MPIPWSAEFLYFMHGMLASGLTIEATVREFHPSFGYGAFGATLARRRDGSHERHYYCADDLLSHLIHGCGSQVNWPRWVVKAGEPGARIVPLTRHDPQCADIAGKLGILSGASLSVESIAGYRVVVYRRIIDEAGPTLALAPDLGCLPMRALRRSGHWWGVFDQGFEWIEVTAVRTEGLPAQLPPPGRPRHHP